VEFLQKQGNMYVAEYAAKFEELSRFCPYINVEDAMVSKCVKFESGLRPEIYQYVSFHEIRDFDTLVHKCRVFDDAGKAKVNYYKAVNDKKGKGHGFGKSYSKVGHKSFECKEKEIVCTIVVKRVISVQSVPSRRRRWEKCLN
jgi:CRISPR/Cas system-associated endonuclease Cas3-HD